MTSLEKAVHAIKSVKVQGAREIAIYSLNFLKDFCRKNGFGLKFEVAVWKLEDARPTAVVLHNVLGILKKKRSIKTINKLLKQLNDAKRKIARNGRKIVKKNSKIMTHCHSGEALSVIEQAWKDKKKISIIATETEPLDQGIKTVKELASKKIPVTLIPDLAIGHFIPEVNMVIVGSDAIRKEGFVNKIGTHMLAEETHMHTKPFYVVGSSFKFDKRKKFILEERPKREVYRSLKGVKIRNPAFDLVPWKYVTAVITEKGIFKPKRIVRMLK